MRHGEGISFASVFSVNQYAWPVSARECRNSKYALLLNLQGKNSNAILIQQLENVLYRIDLAQSKALSFGLCNLHRKLVGFGMECGRILIFRRWKHGIGNAHD